MAINNSEILEMKRYMAQMQAHMLGSQNAYSQNAYSQGLAQLGGIGASLMGNSSGLLEQLSRNRSELMGKTISSLKEALPVKLTKPVPDYVGTLTAWRGWSVREDKLCGLGTDVPWEPMMATPAKCTSKNTHRCPSRSCKCGYWSFRSLETIQEAIKPYHVSIAVLGQVEIWGRVIECENGYRSEYAYPKELWLLQDGLDFLSWTYRVPVRRFQEVG